MGMAPSTQHSLLPKPRDRQRAQVWRERNNRIASIQDESATKPLAGKAGQESQAGEVFVFHVRAGLDFDSNQAPGGVFQ